MPLRLSFLSIRTTVTLAIVAGMVLPALVLIALDRVYSRESGMAMVERQRAAQMVLGASLLTEPAWTLSEPGLRAAVDRLMEDVSVCAVEVLDLQPAAPAPMSLARSRCTADQAMAFREQVVLHEGQSVARLRVAFDDRSIDQVLNERLGITAALVGAQVVLGVLVLAGVLSIRLLRPIDRLKRQASTIAARESAPPLRWSRRDELGQLGQHLNEVRQRIDSLFGELEAKNAELHRLAMYDQLTGLPNRRLLAQLFEENAAEARRRGDAMALLFVDLDRFKTINDALGHAAGDELLVEIGRRLRVALGPQALVCRMGGDEFLVLLPRVRDGAEVAESCDRLLHEMEPPVSLSSSAATSRTTASIGMAMFPDDGQDFETLARMADLAMYRSKESGRARYSFYRPDIDRAFRARLALERELTRAIEVQELVLHYQPIQDARSGRIVGCEALVRWLHPERGLLMPGAFIQAAEETGLIREMGMWTLDSACRQFAAWRACGLALDYVAVNVSVLQAHDPLLPSAVQSAMQRHGLAEGQLELELTESALLSDAEGAMRTVGRLREVGAVLVVDDFGTGYSSLSYLKLLKPQKLKIDRSFVRDLPDDADDKALTQAIIGIAHTLGMAVVAEGVETAAQRALLLAMGCGLQQGYLHGRPVAPEAFAQQHLLQPRPMAPVESA